MDLNFIDMYSIGHSKLGGKRNYKAYYLHDKITGCWLIEKRTIISLIVQLYN